MTKSNKTKRLEFQAGDRVFAKLKGYPWWPARVESVEKNSKPVKYKIMFYATYETNIIKSDSLVLFDEESIQKYGERRKYKFFNEAMDEIQNDPDLNNLNRNEESENSEEEENLSEEMDQDIKIDVEKQSTEPSVSETDSNCESEKSTSKIEERKPKSLKTSTEKSSKVINKEDLEEIDEAISEKSRSSKRLKRATNQLPTKIRKSDREKDIDVETEKKMETDDSESSKSEDSKSDSQKESDLEIDKKTIVRKSGRPKKANKRFLDNEDEVKQKSNKTRRVIVSDEESDSDGKKETSETIANPRTEMEEIESTIDTKKSAEKTVQSPIQSTEAKHKISPKKQVSIQKKNSDNLTEECDKKDKTSKSSKKLPESSNESLNKEPKSDEKIENKSPLSSFELVKKMKKEAKERWSRMTPAEREVEKQKLKEKKIYEKKMAKIKSINIQFALLRMDVEIKKSLKEDNMDIERCCLLIQDLVKLPFTQKNLFKAPEIVETIRKCRKFKGSEKVKEIANECFYKFLYMFPLNPGDSFWTVFEKERVKYLSENEEELKKERIIVNKILSTGVSKSKKNQFSSKSPSSTIIKSDSKPSNSPKKTETKISSDKFNTKDNKEDTLKTRKSIDEFSAQSENSKDAPDLNNRDVLLELSQDEEKNKNQDTSDVNLKITTNFSEQITEKTDVTPTDEKKFKQLIFN